MEMVCIVFTVAFMPPKQMVVSAFTGHLESESSFTRRSNNSVVQIQCVPMCIHQIAFSLLQILY